MRRGGRRQRDKREAGTLVSRSDRSWVLRANLSCLCLLLCIIRIRTPGQVGARLADLHERNNLLCAVAGPGWRMRHWACTGGTCYFCLFFPLSLGHEPNGLT